MAKRAIPILVGLFLLLCLLGVMSLLNIGASTMKHVPVPTQDEIIGSGGSVPSAGSCADVGKNYTDDPFFGWPVVYRQEDWNTISAWYCDPTYKNKDGKVVMHSGIDIATYWCEVGECRTVSIGWSTVIVPTRHAIVREVMKDCPALEAAASGTSLQKCGWPMGNHVKLEALKEEKVCEMNPVSRTVECHSSWVPSGWIATFMHLNKVFVFEGEELGVNDAIGQVGNTGNSGGFHLHYQINSPQGNAVDPAPRMSTTYSDVLRTLGPHFRP